MEEAWYSANVASSEKAPVRTLSRCRWAFTKDSVTKLRFASIVRSEGETSFPISSILPPLIEMLQTFPERSFAFRIRIAEFVCLSLPSYRRAVRLPGSGSP